MPNQLDTIILRRGSRGDRVEILQRALRINNDGKFGPQTETAVINWQRRNGYTPNGQVGYNQFMKITSVITNRSPNKQLTISDINKLNGHIPPNVINELKEHYQKYNITSVLRLSHFLAQCAHESALFRFTTENLNYSADGLRRIFPRYFPGNLAEAYARQPQRIASRAYANRMGNGDEASGDGWKYRGRGYLQLTGKNNYQAFSNYSGTNVVDNPDLVATKYPLSSAGFFFVTNNLWSLCDRGHTNNDVTAVTRRVNGGTNGLADRINQFNRFYNILK